MMMEKAGECLQEKMKDVAEAVSGKWTRKKKQECLKRNLCLTCGGITLFAVGCLAGIHRTVAKALILDEKMPKAPSWHFWCR